jgi:starch-binding outer membrane protein SusE/F
MKIMNKLLFLALVVTGFAACEKLEDLPLYGAGTVPVLTSSAASVAPLPIDSNKAVLTLSWTDPAYATDSSSQKFLVQVDSSGRNFSKAVTKEVTGSLSYTFIAKELNAIMLGWGFEYNKAYDLDMRVISSYANNNERLVTNVVKVNAKTYKVPPKVALPTTGKLYIVGDATDGSWNNPVPTPKQELTKIDETTYGGIFNLTGGKQYLILPLNGNWDNKYSVADNSVPGLSGGGDFGFNQKDNFPGPAASGLYKIILDFQSGKFVVTPFIQQHGLPDSLYIVGDATPGGWDNPPKEPADKVNQKFVRINSTRFEIASIALTAGKGYLFLPETGNWDKKFGAFDNSAPGIKSGGLFAPQGQNIPSPDVSGNYKIVVDFVSNIFSLTKL